MLFLRAEGGISVGDSWIGKVSWMKVFNQGLKEVLGLSEQGMWHLPQRDGRLPRNEKLMVGSS